MKQRKTYVYGMEAIDFLGLCPRDVDLYVIDPPYYKIVKDSWDNRWSSVEAYLQWLGYHLKAARQNAHKKTSLLCFQGIGRPGEKVFPIDHIRTIAADAGWHYRNWITWKKRRAYGKSHDYLFCREEIFWFSASPGRTDVNFAIPLTNQLRGYDGWSKKYPAKSKYKRVSNVWDDIPELMRPKRNCEKPIPLLERLISTHSKKGDLVVDFFAGTGSAGVAARQLSRNFLGCEAIVKDAARADKRVHAVKGWPEEDLTI